MGHRSTLCGRAREEAAVRQAGFSSRSEARAWYPDVESKRMRGEAVQRLPVTLTDHVDRYLEVHAATRDPNTIRVLRERLRRPVSKLGERQLREFEHMSPELAEWQATLPDRSRYGIMQALRRCLEAGVRWGRHGSQPRKAGRSESSPTPSWRPNVHAR